MFAASVLAGCTLAGMALGLMAFTGDSQRTSFGTIESRVHPDLDGHVEVYVPLVDWRVRLLDHRAPARIEIELRGIDRSRAGRGLSSSAAANRSVADVRRDSRRVVETAVRRAVVASAAGGLVGALVGGALLTAVRLRRRWLLLGPAFGGMLAAGLLVPSVDAMRDLDARQVEVTAAGGHARELPTVLRYAEQLLDVGDEYERHYATALRSIRQLASFAGAGAVEPDETAIVISDFHDNVFVLDALAEYAEGRQVFAAGDFVAVGARIVERHAPLVARIGDGLVAVSGNHDTQDYMDALEAGGAVVLDEEEPTMRWGDLLVAGAPDPLEREPGDSEHRLRVYGAEYDEQRAAFVEWFEQLEERPDVVLVHQHGFAHALVDHLAAVGDEKPLLLLVGHDHRPHVHAQGPHVIVDAGTIGAGGIAAVGQQDASFAQLDLRDGRVVAVHLVSVEPLTGRASSERVDIPRPDPVSRRRG